MDCCEENKVDQVCYRCEKHQIEVCDTHPACKDPELFCKFRPSCMIHFMEKENKRQTK